MFDVVYGRKLAVVGDSLLTESRKIEALNRSPYPVDKEMAVVAAQIRDEAVDQIDLAIRISQRTSGNAELMKADQRTDELKTFLSLRKPDRVLVETKITPSPEGQAMQFMPVGNFQRGEMFWESYTPGSVMHIGRYMFRVGTCGYLERVLVLEDPTKHVINAPCR